MVVGVLRVMETYGVRKRDLVVLTPYASQVRLLKEIGPGVEVTTVDSFQGQERDVVVISLVRAGRSGVGFLSSDNDDCIILKYYVRPPNFH